MKKPAVGSSVPVSARLASIWNAVAEGRIPGSAALAALCTAAYSGRFEAAAGPEVTARLRSSLLGLSSWPPEVPASVGALPPRLQDAFAAAMRVELDRDGPARQRGRADRLTRIGDRLRGLARDFGPRAAAAVLLRSCRCDLLEQSTADDAREALVRFMRGLVKEWVRTGVQPRLGGLRTVAGIDEPTLLNLHWILVKFVLAYRTSRSGTERGQKKTARAAAPRVVPLAEAAADSLGDAELGPPDQAARRESVARLREWLGRQPPELQLKISIYFFSGWPDKRVEQALGLPAGSAKGRRRNLLKQLRAALADLAPPDPEAAPRIRRAGSPTGTGRAPMNGARAPDRGGSPRGRAGQEQQEHRDEQHQNRPPQDELAPPLPPGREDLAQEHRERGENGQPGREPQNLKEPEKPQHHDRSP